MKLTKKLFAIAMATVMVFSTSAMSVSAAKWVKSDNGIMYQYDNGSYAKSKWIKTKSGDKYYIQADGTRATGWTEIDGDMYYFNKKTGKATINKKIVIGSYSYKFDKNGVWNGKVYSKDGKKNVTKKVDVAKLTGQTNTTSTNKTTTTSKNELGVVKKVEGKIPATVKINGRTYNTSATNVFQGKTADPVYPKGSTGNRYDRKSMWVFDISGCSDKDLEVLKYFTNIESIELIDYDNTSTMTNLDFCYYMPNLTHCTVSGAVNLTNVDGLSACKNLERLEVEFSKITNVDGLKTLKNLKKFLFGYTHLDNVDGLVNCTKLEEVELSYARLTDISGLKNKDKLTTLTLSLNRRLQDISVLATCDNLKTLYMNSCTSVNTWETLKEIPKLKYVAVYHNVTGSKGPYEVAKWLNNNGVEATGLTSKSLERGTHNKVKETAEEKAWDFKYRPATVYGDELKCKSNCEVCKIDVIDAYKCLQ